MTVLLKTYNGYSELEECDMKITILNGSPRQNGNTNAIVDSLSKGLRCNHEVELINVTQKEVHGCIACNYCKSHDGVCVHRDDTNYLLQVLEGTDLILFASPVYWWGISAQLKLVVDKFYANQSKLKGKSYGIISVGAAELDNIQYKLISSQFESIAGFLSWEKVLDECETAYEAHELRENKDILNKYYELGKSL